MDSRGPDLRDGVSDLRFWTVEGVRPDGTAEEEEFGVGHGGREGGERRGEEKGGREEEFRRSFTVFSLFSPPKRRRRPWPERRGRKGEEEEEEMKDGEEEGGWGLIYREKQGTNGCPRMSKLARILQPSITC